MSKKALKTTELVKTFEEALELLESRSPGITEEFRMISEVSTRYSRRIIPEFKLMTIIEVLNDGWIPNWFKYNQRKWYPWFFVGGTAINGSLAGLSYVNSSYSASATAAYIGSRLCCKSEELAEYVGRTFLTLYNEFLLG